MDFVISRNKDYQDLTMYLALHHLGILPYKIKSKPSKKIRPKDFEHCFSCVADVHIKTSVGLNK